MSTGALLPVDRRGLGWIVNPARKLGYNAGMKWRNWLIAAAGSAFIWVLVRDVWFWAIMSAIWIGAYTEETLRYRRLNP